MCNRTQNDAIWGLIALFLTNQIAGNTNDFKNIKQKHMIRHQLSTLTVHTLIHTNLLAISHVNITVSARFFLH